MKYFAVAALALTIGGPAIADPVQGLWKTQPDDNGRFGHVRIGTCDGGTVCGSLVGAFEADGLPRQSDAIGRAIIWDMQSDGANSWKEGRIYAPDRDKTYNSRMSLEGDRLSVSGCVLGICRAKVWTRVN